MGSEVGCVCHKVSSMAEHQTMNLAVTGSTPVPNAVLNKSRSDAKASPNARGGGRTKVCRWYCVRAARESASWCHVSAATQDGALQCADTAGASLWQRQTD